MSSQAQSQQSPSSGGGQPPGLPPLFGGQPPPHMNRQPGGQPMQQSPSAGVSPGGGERPPFFPPSGPPPQGLGPSPRGGPPHFHSHPPTSGPPPPGAPQFSGGGGGGMSPHASGGGDSPPVAPPGQLHRPPPAGGGDGSGGAGGGGHVMPPLQPPGDLTRPPRFGGLVRPPPGLPPPGLNARPPPMGDPGLNRPPGGQSRPPGPSGMADQGLRPPGPSGMADPGLNRPPRPPGPSGMADQGLRPPGASGMADPGLNKPPGPSSIQNRPPGPLNIQVRPPGAPNLQNMAPGNLNRPPGPPNVQNRPPGPPGVQSMPPGPPNAQSRPPGPPNMPNRPPGPPNLQGVGRPPDVRPPLAGVRQPPPSLGDASSRPPGPGPPNSADMGRPPPQPNPPLSGETGGPRFQPPTSGLPPGPPRGPHNANIPRPLMNQPFPHQGPPPVGDFPPGGPTEVWFEHTSAEGKVYYSHPQTRKTVWERPQNARIIPPPPFPPPGFPPTLPGNPQLVPTRVWSDHQTPDGRTYYYNKVTKQSVWEIPKDFELVMPLPLSFSTPPTIPLSSEKKSDASSQQDVGVASSGGGEGAGDKESKMEVDEGKPQEGVATKEKQNSTGGGGGEGTAATTTSSSSSSATTSPAPRPSGPLIQPPLLGAVPPHHGFPPPSGLPPPALLPPGLHPMPPPPHMNMMAPPPAMDPRMPLPLPAPGPQALPQQPAVQEPVKQEPTGPRPVATEPIPGTPWSIVWTSDDRKFFFNATKNVSVWSTPSDLIGNENLEQLLDNPPVAAGGKRRSSLKDGPSSKRLKLSDSENSEEEDEVVVAEGVPVISSAGDTKPVVGGPEAELKAAQLRASKPLEERQQEFKAMLLERGVSAFSTWEKELPKFVFDPRYMLLTVKERKACFQSFIRSRTEEERREKKNKLKAMKDRFRSLLETAKLTPKSSFSEFASKYGKDERFKAVEKMREREQMFTEFLGELKKGGAKQQQHQQQQQQKDPSRTKAEKVKVDFMAMLAEGQQGITEQSQWRKVKGSFDQDPRYKAVESSSRREEFFVEFQKSLKDQEMDPEQLRQERIQASLKEREREVQMSRSAQEKEWGRERDQLRKNEALQQYKALLVDHVRGAQVQWHEAKRSMKRDQRWEVTKMLEHEEREQLFQDHVLELANKKRLHFRKLLEETPQITLDMPWKKARKLIKEDMRYKSFTDSDYKREVEYDKYQRDKLSMAKNEFRSLLKETKVITYKSCEMVRESGRHYKDIIDVLKNDKRFLVLDCVAGEREDILYGYLEEMQHKGPPPPPTATHPGERLKRPQPS